MRRHARRAFGAVAAGLVGLGAVRADLLSQRMSNGFPTCRRKEQRVISVQFRLRGCVNEVRGKAPPMGGEEFTNLELYVAWRAQCLPVEPVRR